MILSMRKDFIIVAILVQLMKQVFCFIPSNRLMRNAPIVIADEIQTLNQEIKSGKKKLLLFDYKMTPKSGHTNVTNVEKMKMLYSHVKDKSEKQMIIQESPMITVVSVDCHPFQCQMEDRYNLDVQNINILRAFQNGVYEPPREKVDNDSISWKEVKKMKEMVKNFQFSLSTSLYYMSTEILYHKFLKRQDSISRNHFDLSRHLIVIEDCDVRKEIKYLKTIQNPIAIKITGKLYYKQLISYLDELESTNQSEIIFIISYTKLLSLRRILPYLFHDYYSWNQSGNERQTKKRRKIKHIVFQLNSYGKRNYTSTDIENDIKFIQRLKDKYNLENIGYYMRYTYEEDDNMIHIS